MCFVKLCCYIVMLLSALKRWEYLRHSGFVTALALLPTALFLFASSLSFPCSPSSPLLSLRFSLRVFTSVASVLTKLSNF